MIIDPKVSQALQLLPVYGINPSGIMKVQEKLGLTKEQTTQLLESEHMISAKGKYAEKLATDMNIRLMERSASQVDRVMDLIDGLLDQYENGNGPIKLRQTDVDLFKTFMLNHNNLTKQTADVQVNIQNNINTGEDKPSEDETKRLRDPVGYVASKLKAADQMEFYDRIELLAKEFMQRIPEVIDV